MGSCGNCKYAEVFQEHEPCLSCQTNFIPPTNWTAAACEGMTNADRIRSMTDEELAEWHETCPYIEEECTMKGCLQCVREWLQQPWEGE